MKYFLKVIIFIFLTGLFFLAAAVIFVSCKREYSCENCRERNKPPIANAGNDTLIILPADSVLLDGSNSADPDDGIAGYSWKKIAGPDTFKISNVLLAKTIVNKLVKATYLFELTVNDKGGLSAKDTVSISVVPVVFINRPPIANAGNDTSIVLPANSANLDGSGSTDPDNNITGYLWTKIFGPNSFNIANLNAMQTQVTNLIPGVYQFELKVTDAGGLLSKDTIQIIVKAAAVVIDCNGIIRSQISAQLVPIGTLSLTREGMAVVSAGNKIFFAGGFTGDYTAGFQFY